MAGFKTNKGTELPLLNLKGKDYLQVAHRLVWFREEHPLGCIESKCIESNEKYVIYKASISIPVEGVYVKLADAVKREDYSHFPDANEKCETGAIGRALAMCGFGTQFAPELEEGERIVDAPVERKSSIGAATKAKGNYGNSTGTKNNQQGSGHNASQAMAPGASTPREAEPNGVYTGAARQGTQVSGASFPGAEGRARDGESNANNDREDPESFSNRNAPTAPYGSGTYAGDPRGSVEPQRSDRGNSGEVRPGTHPIVDTAKWIFGSKEVSNGNQEGGRGNQGSGAGIVNPDPRLGLVQGEVRINEFYNEVLFSIGETKTISELMQVWNKYRGEVKKLPAKLSNQLILEKEEKKNELSQTIS